MVSKCIAIADKTELSLWFAQTKAFHYCAFLIISSSQIVKVCEFDENRLILLVLVGTSPSELNRSNSCGLEEACPPVPRRNCLWVVSDKITEFVKKLTAAITSNMPKVL